MRKISDSEALHIIETMIRRRLKLQNKDAGEDWIKSKALEIHDESKAKGDYIQQLEADTELQ